MINPYIDFQTNDLSELIKCPNNMTCKISKQNKASNAKNADKAEDSVQTAQ